MSLANVYAWETCFLMMFVSFNFVSTVCYGFFSCYPFSGLSQFHCHNSAKKMVSWVVLFIESFVVFSGGEVQFSFREIYLILLCS